VAAVLAWALDKRAHLLHQNNMPTPYPALTAPLAEMLRRITPSGGEAVGVPTYYACAARLKTGRVIERVYLCEAEVYIRYWGFWPQDEINLLDIVSLEESRFRLPAHFANAIYEAGETGMGYFAFRVNFHDGTNISYLTGSAVDFIDYPPEKTATDVANINSFGGREPSQRRGAAPCSWCFFSLTEGTSCG
jgi:hypothetical protein